MTQRERYYLKTISTGKATLNAVGKLVLGTRQEVRSRKADSRRSMERGVGRRLSGRQWTKLRKAFRLAQRAIT